MTRHATPTSRHQTAMRGVQRAVALAVITMLGLTGVLASTLVAANPAWALAFGFFVNPPAESTTFLPTQDGAIFQAFDGEGNPGDSIRLFAVANGGTPDTTLCTTTVALDGTWVCSVTAMPDTFGVFRAEVTSGVQAGASRNREFNALNPPTLTNASLPGNGYESRFPASFAFQGSTYASPFTAVTATVPGVGSCTVPVLANPFTCPIDFSFADDGAYNYTITTTTSFGTSRVRSGSVLIDTTSPDFTSMTSPTDGAVVANLTPTITGTGEPGGTAFPLFFPSFAPACEPTPINGAGIWSCRLSTLAPGSYTVGSYQEDAIGNTGPSPDPQVTFTVVAPIAPPAAPPPAEAPLPSAPVEEIAAPAPAPTPIPTTAGAGAGAAATPAETATTTTATRVLANETSDLPIDRPSDPPNLELTTESIPEPSSEPDPGPASESADDTVTAAATTVAGVIPVVGGGGLTDPTVFGTSLRTPFDVFATPGVVIAGAIAGAAAFLLFVAIPAELLHSTVRENYHRLPSWGGVWRSRLNAFSDRVQRRIGPTASLIAVIALVAAVSSFVDPNAGFTASTLRLGLAIAISLLVVNLLGGLLLRSAAQRWFAVDVVPRILPAAIFLTLATVLLSRLFEVAPGLLFGLVLGTQLARELKRHESGRLAAFVTTVLLGLGLGAWLLYGASVSLGSAEPGFAELLWRETLVAITVESLSALVITLLPIMFMDGREIWRWSKPAWAGLTAVALVIFVVIVLPMPSSWAEASGPLAQSVLLFVGFMALTAVIWAVFRGITVREERAASRSAQSAVSVE
jgi:hypothetical protein